MTGLSLSFLLCFSEKYGPTLWFYTKPYGKLSEMKSHQKKEKQNETLEAGDMTFSFASPDLIFSCQTLSLTLFFAL